MTGSDLPDSFAQAAGLRDHGVGSCEDFGFIDPLFCLVGDGCFGLRSFRGVAGRCSELGRADLSLVGLVVQCGGGIE